MLLRQELIENNLNLLFSGRDFILRNPSLAFLNDKKPKSRIYKSYLITNDLKFILFSRLYVLALFIHYAKRWNEPEITVLFLILAVTGTFNLKTTLPFLFANFILIIIEISGFPRIANHTTFALLASIFVLAYFLWAFLQGRDTSEKFIFKNLAGGGLLVYFFAGFHKLNTGFLDTSFSCAIWFVERLQHNYFHEIFNLPSWLISTIPRFIIVLELLVVVLLIFRKSRIFGIYSALFLHLTVSLSGFTDFSALMMSILILFLPTSFFDSIKKNWNQLRLFIKGLILYSLSVIAYSIYSGFAHLIWYHYLETISIVLGLIFNTASLIFITIISILYWKYQKFIKNKKVGIFSGSHQYKMKVKYLLFPAVIFVWGSFPYLFGTQSSFTMFSNLITESKRQNHLLLNTDYTKIWDFEEDLVKIIDFKTDTRVKGRYDLQGYFLPVSEFKYIASRMDTSNEYRVSIEIEYNGEKFIVDDLANSKFTDAPFYTNLFTFRNIDPLGIPKCVW